MTPIQKVISHHRHDIDGMRAIAVLSVIVFHINPAWMPGGFIGVDVFFVLSGYLITGQILDQLQSREFSLSEFYRRRIRRIAPAMVAVTLVTLVVGAFSMLPRDSEALAKSAVWSLASMANVYFWREADVDYFAPSSQLIPLLHMWSLGVEEQFYLAWPLALMLAWRLCGPEGRLRVIFWMASGSVILGVALGEASLADAPRFAYYMIPTRAGELGIGAALATFLRLHRGSAVGRRPSFLSPNLLAWLGMALLFFSLFWLEERMPFPGWRSLIPTVGTTLLLAAGVHRRVHDWSAVLSSPPARWLGAVSYSAYLWHWPILAFWRYLQPDMHLLDQCLAFVITMAAAWASYRWIEQPARQVALRDWWPALALPSFLILVAGVFMVYGPRIGMDWEPSGYRQAVAKMAADAQSVNRHPKECLDWAVSPALLKSDQCVFGRLAAGTPKVILLGDSNAAHFIGLLDVVAERAGFSVRNVSLGACPPLLGELLVSEVATRPRDCAPSLALVEAELHRYPVIVLAAAWSSYGERSPDFFPSLERVIRRLAVAGHHVVVLGKASEHPGFDADCRQKAIKLSWLDCSQPAQAIALRVADANARLADVVARIPGVRFLDVSPYLCPDGRCSVYAESGLALYRDRGHLSNAGSVELGRRIANDPGALKTFVFDSHAHPLNAEK